MQVPHDAGRILSTKAFISQLLGLFEKSAYADLDAQIIGLIHICI